jgi:hypothetical protein
LYRRAYKRASTTPKEGEGEEDEADEDKDEEDDGEPQQTAGPVGGATDAGSPKPGRTRPSPTKPQNFHRETTAPKPTSPVPTATGIMSDPLDVDDLLSGPEFAPDPEDDDVAVEKEVIEADDSSEAEPDTTAARLATRVA